MTTSRKSRAGTSLHPRRSVVVRAPVRADLAGGTLDLWPLGLLQRDAVTVAVAVDLDVVAEVGPAPRRGHAALSVEGRGGARCVDLSAPFRTSRHELLERIVRALAPERGATVSTRSPVRRGSGLGTSSALGVAIAYGLHRSSGARPDARRIVALVRDVEAQILGIPTGTQDHWAAYEGGAVVCAHRPGGPEVANLPKRIVEALGRRLLLVDSGEARSSGPSNWDMYRRAIGGDTAALGALAKVARAGRLAAEGLSSGDFRRVGRAMRLDHEARAEWSDLVVTEGLAAIVEAARAAGALGVKICGAGGGGYAVVLAPDGEIRERIARAVEEVGAVASGARPSHRGVGAVTARSGRG